MSLLFFDGFDGYSNYGNMPNSGNWSTQYIQAQQEISSVARGGAGKSLATMIGSPGGRYTGGGYIKTLFANQGGNTLVIGMALKTVATSGPLWSLHDTDGAIQCSLYVNASGFLEARRGDNAATLATGSTVVNGDDWLYVEAKILVGSSGSFEVKVSGITQFSFSGNTQNAGTNNVSQFASGCVNVGSDGTTYIDDVYILNTLGSVNNNYLGEVRCEILTPTSDAAVQWSPSTGSTNYTNIDELGNPNDADYNFDTVSGHRDEYGLSNLSSPAVSVFAVKVCSRLAKSDSGSISAKYGINSGGTRQSTSVAPTVGFVNYQTIFESSDGAGTAWTDTLVNAALSLVEIV